jgi:hypothetical protein
MAFAAARMILKDKRRKSKEDFVPPRQRSKVDDNIKLIFPHFLTLLPPLFYAVHMNIHFHLFSSHTKRMMIRICRWKDSE